MKGSSSASLRFPYVRFQVVDPFTKRWSSTYRPVVPITLQSKKTHLRSQALIDSGADECIFSGEIASALGFRLQKGKLRLFGGIGGSAVGYLHWTMIQVGNCRIRCPIYYSDEWNHLEFGLLGQAGFLSHFKITLDHHAKQITLVP